MKQFLPAIIALQLLWAPATAHAGNYWKQVDPSAAPKNVQLQHPDRFTVYRLDEADLKARMWNLSEDPAEAIVISLPLPDGSYRDFRVWQTPMMPPVLAQKYPDIKTFTAEAVGAPAVTAKLDFTVYGFSAMIYDGENTSFIDPFDNYHDGFYLVHYKRDERRNDNDRMRCEFRNEADELAGGEAMITAETGLPKLAQKTSNGYELRTYRLALSCSNQYAVAATGVASPTITQTLSKMTTTMNRVNGVYNREFSVQMNFVANEDTLIWTAPTGTINGNDPFNSINSNGAACLGVNHTTCTNRIGTANFDLGHVFTTGGGGISGLGIVCNSSQKGRSVTGLPTPVGDGFDIDYVAHEMGHEFGSNHTFNNNSDGSCSGNASSNYAYEPSSGSTILAYAGICSPDNVQNNSDAYFHASSLVQIQGKLAGSQNVCAVRTSTGNKLVYLAPFTASYKIPYKTPFELIAPTAVDSVADTSVTYCWEQWNRGDFGSRIKDTYFRGPIFRSYSPKKYDPLRTFPKLSMILSGNLTAVTASGSLGEKAPDTTRFLTFKLTVRNIFNGKGCFLFPDDTVHIDAISTGAANNYGGFKVTSQNAFGITYEGGSTQTITWDKVGTDAAPYNVANVKIYMSTDAGVTWPYTVGTFPNTGTASITVPNPPATSAVVRFKVKAENNIFFNINTRSITVTNNPGLATGITQPVGTLAATLKVYPVPAHDLLQITTGTGGNSFLSIISSTGQMMWKGTIGASAEVPVSNWARGIYFVRVTDATGGEQVARTVVLE
ncbi:MAG: zinc-dependent metalloprotease [Flavipsychrobacter sp.]|nr:zinc-dependent metalloprotease [Flavipsychrobacter sp.]